MNTGYSSLLKELQEKALELESSKESLEVTLRSIGDAVIATNPEGKVTFLNAVAEELTQVTGEKAFGRPLIEIFRIVNEETRAAVENPVDKVVRLNAIVGLANHTVLVRPDGSEICIDDSGAPIRNEKGELLGVVLVFRDITEQREMMNALRANEKLAAAGRLSAAIAHEIHNPLETVNNLLFLLEKDPSAGNRGELVKLAQQELSRVVQITTNMLSLYRESKSAIPVSLTEVVDSVTGLLERRIRDKQAKVLKQAVSNGEIFAFPAEMRQLVSNLMNNAIEAVEAGGSVEVEIKDTALKNGSPGVVISVRDKGHGISKEHLPNLFRPFFTTKGEKGTGLGLWISHGIVEKHGGYIEVHSSTDAQDHGTTFNVFIPRSAARVTSTSSHA